MADDATQVDISRLQRRRDFLRVAAERRKWVTPGLILQAAPMPRGDLKSRSASASCAETASHAEQASVTVPAPPSARVGFTVSKKVGNSVQRNRARRRLRAAADALMGRLATAQTDYVIIGRVQTLDRPFEALLKDLETALKRVLSAPKSDPFPGKGGRKGPPRKTKPRAEDGKSAAPESPPKVSGSGTPSERTPPR